MLLSKRSLFFSTFVILLVFAGVMRIVATYHIFNHTWDEPVHFTAGLEWLDLGTYTYEAQHPPLVRIAIALGPFLSGIRISEDQREFLHNARRHPVHGLFSSIRPISALFLAYCVTVPVSIRPRTL